MRGEKMLKLADVYGSQILRQMGRAVHGQIYDRKCLDSLRAASDESRLTHHTLRSGRYDRA